MGVQAERGSTDEEAMQSHRTSSSAEDGADVEGLQRVRLGFWSHLVARLTDLDRL